MKVCRSHARQHEGAAITACLPLAYFSLTDVRSCGGVDTDGAPSQAWNDAVPVGVADFTTSSALGAKPGRPYLVGAGLGLTPATTWLV